MADRPENYRDVKLLAGAEGSGFILEYDLMGKRDGDSLGGLVFLRTVREVFSVDEGQKALNKLMIFSGSMVPVSTGNSDHESS